ncbi:hypothetical protein ACFL0Y_00290 [Patescibacteria group bacterium]
MERVKNNEARVKKVDFNTYANWLVDNSTAALVRTRIRFEKKGGGTITLEDNRALLAERDEIALGLGKNILQAAGTLNGRKDLEGCTLNGEPVKREMTPSRIKRTY